MPAGMTAAAPATGPAHELAEHFLEDIAEAAEPLPALAEALEAARTRAAAFECGMAEAVVGGALFAVLENLVSLVQFLELLLGFLVVGIAVGVILHGELAIGALQLAFVSAFVDAENVVVIAFVSHVGKALPDFRTLQTTIR
jgi:hypothetical protein